MEKKVGCETEGKIATVPQANTSRSEDLSARKSFSVEIMLFF